MHVNGLKRIPLDSSRRIAALPVYQQAIRRSFINILEYKKMSKSLSQLCPDFEEWPERWMELPEDIAFGKKIIGIFRPFIFIVHIDALATLIIIINITSVKNNGIQINQSQQEIIEIF